MTHERNSMPSDDQRWLDQLVDGELDESARRQLLMELENQPDGWRRCALAFLEAQAWKDTLGSLVSAPPKDAAPRPPQAIGWRGSSWGTVLAAAASFLLAFALGLAWRGQAEGPDAPGLAQMPPAKAPAATINPPELGLTSDKTQWGTMTVGLDRNGDGVSESLELPVVRGPGIDEEWVRNQPIAIPPDVFREFERRGHQVQHHRQYYPFDLGNGGRVLVPVDELDVRYVQERQFQ